MGFFDKIERGLEKTVNRAFAKTFKSAIQPLEITAALKKEMDSKSTIISRERILVPGKYRVQLSPTDHSQMVALGVALIDELQQELSKHAKSLGYSYPGGLMVALQPNETLPKGTLEILTENMPANTVWVPALDFGNRIVKLKPGKMVLGRDSGVDIRLSDTGASRQHLEISWDGKLAKAKDLGSTNGTKLNGIKFKESQLNQGDTIQIGTTVIKFFLSPEDRQ